MLDKLNQAHAERYPGSSELAARISSYELAYRMQGCAPEAVDINRESDATKKLYGLDEKITEPVWQAMPDGEASGRARRPFRAGFSGGLGVQNKDTWDAHADMKENHALHAKESDTAHRRLADRSESAWSAGFNSGFLALRIRSNAPLREWVGRDHNPMAMTCWMAGAGIKGGQSIGTSDEVGYKAERQPISYHDLHATILALLGMEHTKLTYRYNGRDMRLTDVAGELIPQIVGKNWGRSPTDGLNHPRHRGHRGEQNESSLRPSVPSVSLWFRPSVGLRPHFPFRG
jgi:hypothetical protein